MRGAPPPPRTDANAAPALHALCSRGPTPARSRCGARRLAVLARAAGALSLGYFVCVPPEPGGTTNVQPSSRPRKLPRMRRGMYRPASTNSQAGESSPAASGRRRRDEGSSRCPTCARRAKASLTETLRRRPRVSAVRMLFLQTQRASGRYWSPWRLGPDRLNLDFPPFRRGHSGPIGVLAHETTSRWSIGDENHTGWDLPFHASEDGLAVLGSNPNGTT